MEYRRIGSSNLKVSRLGLGAMGIGSTEWRGWVLDEAASRPIVKRCLDVGINFIDTCDFYSGGRSEEVVGRLLKEFIPREEIVLATKAGNPMGKGPNGRGYSRKHLIEAAEQSLRRLGVDYIDLYQTHIWDSTTNLEEMATALDHLVRTGKVLYVGITDMPTWQFAKCLYFQRHNRLAEFVSVQNHYNPIWREDERELIPLCLAEGVGLVPYSPMARGFLCGRARRTDAPTIRVKTDDYAEKIYGRESDSAVADAIEAVAAARGVEPGQVALAWTLSRPGIAAPIFGPTRVEHVDAAIAALDIVLEAGEAGQIESAYQPRPAAGHGI